MKPIKFQIDFILKRKEYGLLIVKYLGGEKDFQITSKSKLEDIPIEAYLGMPRKIDENGNLVLDSFILKPKLKSDLDKFKIGQIVTLN